MTGPVTPGPRGDHGPAARARSSRASTARARSAPALAAADLDRTLIYSSAACRIGLPVGAAAPEVLSVEVYQGEHISFLTPTAAAVLAELNERQLLVPTTTRTLEQYRRVALPGPPPAFAVCANGGHLLRDGVEDLEWNAWVRKRLAAHSAPLAEVVAHLEAVGDPAWTLKLRTADDLFAYLVVDRAALPGDFVSATARWAGERGWGVSMQGRKLYLVPSTLTKGAAVREVAERAGAGAVFAAGDSLLDIELLMAADEGVRPGHGELADTGWSAPHVEALPERGVAAGERIAMWLAARVAPGLGSAADRR